ncbi:transporter substrate-binding domain-containing protein [Legionella sp. km772]|uniref:transporter substrate-binding domain-containing protein n=1 Tax=Legionella sp. km772 TaxID=2498111 RepID=UPI000F8CEA52|nr:transporter substrate-binding domain-containing protein [Legionella sp. km772]RUR11316.1 transporter substrate-binding domain-containing protein [Legionella sp. km772]
MRFLSFLLSFSVFISTSCLAQVVSPLKVAVANFSPPFVMQGANQQLYGYDIAMMEYICQSIKRPCRFIPTSFDNVLNTVQNKQADVAASSITITANRAELFNFSLPYLLSYARFIGPKQLNSTFEAKSLTNKKIGIIKGSVFPELIKHVGIENPEIVSFVNLNTLVDALNKGEIHVGLMDNPSALYWQSRSSGVLSVLGEPINYGIGFGIAISRDNAPLLSLINKALLEYQDSKHYEVNYHSYLSYYDYQ